MAEIGLPRRLLEGASGFNVVIHQMRASLGSVRAEWKPDPETMGLPASGDLVVMIKLEGDTRFRGRMRKSDVIDTNFDVEVSLGEIRLRLRPVVAHHRTGRNKLGFRQQDVTLRDFGGNELGGDDLNVIEGIKDDVRKVFGVILGLLGSPPTVVLESTFAMGTFFDFIIETAVGSGIVGAASDLDTGGFSSAATNIVTALAEDATFGSVLFGVESSSLPVPGAASSGRPVLEGMIGGDGLLDLRYRGDRLRTVDLRNRLHSDPVQCCLLEEPSGDPEPSPNCLEQPDQTEASCQMMCTL